MSPRAAPEPAAIVRLGVPIAVLVGAMLLLPVGDVRGGASAILVFGATGPVAGVLDLLAGQALLLAGTLAWLLGPRAGIGTLAVLAGVAWFGPDLFALRGADPLVRAIGRFLLGPLVLPLLLHLSLLALGLDGGRRTRVGLAVLYVAAVAIALWSAATYQPLLDRYCIDCTWRNPLLLASDYLMIRAGRLAGSALAIGVSMAAAVVAVRRFSATIRLTAAQALIGLGTLGLAAAAGVRGVLMLTSPKEDPVTSPWSGAWLILTLAALTMAIGVGGLAVETWRRATRLRSIGDSLEAAPAPGTLETALRQALGDPGLHLSYRLDDGATVDADGATVDLTPGPDRVLTPVERDGVQLAQVSHARGVDPSALALAFGPALLVALDNERLRAARLAQLTELRASRARIVAEGDTARRRLERDLHDGVQQQLLSVLFDVRLARLAAERAADHARATRLAAAEALAQGAVDELRRIAHGIHPAVLSRSGLGPALASLADEAPLPLEVTLDGVGRLPEAVEAAAYQVVVDALLASSAMGAEGMGVRVVAEGSALTMELHQDAAVGAGPVDPEVPVRIADRVGAAGGEAIAVALPGGGTLLRVELPCV